MNRHLSIQTPIYAEPETIPLAAIAERLTHRIRNPLSVITTAASQLQVSCNTAVDHDDISFVDSIVIAAEQIEALLKRFVLLACPEPAVTEIIDLNDLCRAEINRRRHEMTDGIAANISLHPDENLPGIACDPGQIRILLSDLVDNGLRAAGPVGKVIIRTGHSCEAVRFTIEDSGTGMTARQKKESLKPFVTNWPGRNGLGLAIADRIVTSHKGLLELKNRRGGGTVVIVTLPRTAWIEE